MPLTFSSKGTHDYTVCVTPLCFRGGAPAVRVAVWRCPELAPASPRADAGSSADSGSTLHRLSDALSVIQGYLENFLDGAIQDSVQMRQSFAAMHRQALRIRRVLGNVD